MQKVDIVKKMERLERQLEYQETLLRHILHEIWPIKFQDEPLNANFDDLLELFNHTKSCVFELNRIYQKSDTIIKQNGADDIKDGLNCLDKNSDDKEDCSRFN